MRTEAAQKTRLQCDAVRDFAKDAKAAFRGHNLCWGNNNPDWLANLDAVVCRFCFYVQVTGMCLGHLQLRTRASDGSLKSDCRPADCTQTLQLARPTSMKLRPSQRELT